MKILVVDPIGERGHIKYNKYTLSILASMGELEFLSTTGYSEIAMGICKHALFPTSVLDRINNRLFSRITLYLRCKYALSYFKKSGLI